MLLNIILSIRSIGQSSFFANIVNLSVAICIARDLTDPTQVRKHSVDLSLDDTTFHLANKQIRYPASPQNIKDLIFLSFPLLQVTNHTMIF
jgi:hypothetical protein